MLGMLRDDNDNEDMHRQREEVKQMKDQLKKQVRSSRFKFPTIIIACEFVQINTLNLHESMLNLNESTLFLHESM